MPLLELPLITAIFSFLTLCVTLWIGYSLDRYVHYDDPHVTFRQRLRHPRTPARQLAEQQRRKGEERT